MVKEESPLTTQLHELAANISPASGEAKSPDGLRRVEIDPTFPEADLLAQLVLNTLTDQDSFIHARDPKRFLLASKAVDDETAWRKSVAWQLYPDIQYRFGGISQTMQIEREKYISTQIEAEQPLNLDLQTLWVDHIGDEPLQIGELSIIETMVGLAQILHKHHQLDSSLRGSVTLRIAVEPHSTEPPTISQFETYVAKLRKLLLNSAKAAGINIDQIELKLIAVPELLATNPQATEYSQESELTTEIEQFADKIAAYWLESEAIYSQYLQDKRLLASNADLTWNDVVKGNWLMHSQRKPADQNRDNEYYFRLSLDVLGKEKLSQLKSWQALSPEEQAALGWLTPRAKAELLSQATAPAGQVSTFTPENLTASAEQIKAAARTLATKIIAEQLHADENLLKFQFGKALPDLPLHNVLRLRYFGNLTHDQKQQPWQNPRLLSYTQGENEKTLNLPLIDRLNRSVPDRSGLSLQPIAETELWLRKKITYHVGDSQVEIPLQYKPQAWLLQLMKHAMGVPHE